MTGLYQKIIGAYLWFHMYELYAFFFVRGIECQLISLVPLLPIWSPRR
jgi:hypothetical protein